ASAATTRAALEPNSSSTLVGAASWAIRCPILADPVKDTAPIRRSVVNAAPTSGPPVISCTAARGASASANASRITYVSHSVANGVCGAGLMITGQPAATAGAI